MDETISRSCLIVGFGISGVEISDSAAESFLVTVC